MKLAIAQLNYTIGDFTSNKAKIINAINLAKADGANLIAFAEFAISGSPAYDLLNRVNFLMLCEDTLAEIAQACDGIAAIVGLPIQQNCSTLSAAAFIQNRKIVKFISRKLVNNRDDVAFISSGSDDNSIVIDDRNFSIVLGDDILNPDQFLSAPTHSVINIGASQYARQIIEKRYNFFGKLAFRIDSNIVFVNQVGANTDVIYDGSSAVFNHKGEPIALLDSFREDYRVIDLDGDNTPLEIPYQNKTKNVYNAIKLGLHDFFAKNGYTKACLGLSGGIDSAVVAALAVEVLGPQNVKVLLMPSQFSSDHSVEDAVKMAELLGVDYNIVPISDIYKLIVSDMAPVFGENTDFGITEENIQARIRGMLLMALSNKFGHILLNTSNKSELALGWGTLYGDNTGMISILGDVYKSEVFDMARYINRDSVIIPENILLKAPSAELRPEQKDSDYLPPYDITDAIIYRMIENGQSREEVANAGFDAEVVGKIYRMILQNEPKRRQLCPVLRVSTCPFRSSRIVPITSKYGF